MTPNALVSLPDAELLDSTHALLDRSNFVEADLLTHLGEVEARKLHLERAFSSMFEFCVEELGMSEGVAFNRIYVARLARQLPLVLDWVRDGRIHLSGLRVLVPHLTEANAAELLAEASGKSKRDIEALVTRFAPRPPVATTIRKLPAKPAPSTAPESAPRPPTPEPMATRDTAPAPELVLAPPPARPRLDPLTPDTFALTFTMSRALREKVKQAQDLMRHRVPNGDFGAILEQALDVLLEKVKKERFGVGRTPRPAAVDPIPGEGAEGSPHVTRHFKAAIRRVVYERDGARCTFLSEEGRRCAETGGLELEHLDGFAIEREHDVTRIVLRCRPHNQHAAWKMYGPAKMVPVKNSLSVTCPGTGAQERLF